MSGITEYWPSMVIRFNNIDSPLCMYINIKYKLLWFIPDKRFISDHYLRSSKGKFNCLKQSTGSKFDVKSSWTFFLIPVASIGFRIDDPEVVDIDQKLEFLRAFFTKSSLFEIFQGLYQLFRILFCLFFIGFFGVVNSKFDLLSKVLSLLQL